METRSRAISKLNFYSSKEIRWFLSGNKPEETKLYVHKKKMIVARDTLIFLLQNLGLSKSDKYKKSSPSTLSEDRVPASYCRFKRNDPIPSTGKGFGNNRAVLPISHKRPSFSERYLSTN